MHAFSENGILAGMRTDNLTPPAFQPPDPAHRIRPVQAADTAALAANCWPNRPLDAVRMLVLNAMKLTEHGRGVGVVALDDKHAIGYGQLTLWANCGEISDLVIAPQHRGMGIGTSIIRYLMQSARESGLPCIEIGAARSNPRALALYRRLGFCDNHEVMLNLGNGKEPVLYLQLSLRSANHTD